MTRASFIRRAAAGLLAGSLLEGLASRLAPAAPAAPAEAASGWVYVETFENGWGNAEADPIGDVVAWASRARATAGFSAPLILPAAYRVTTADG